MDNRSRDAYSMVETLILIILVSSSAFWLASAIQPAFSSSLSPLAVESAAGVDSTMVMSENKHQPIGLYVYLALTLGLVSYVGFKLFRRKQKLDREPRTELAEEIAVQLRERKPFESAALYQKREALLKKLIERFAKDGDSTVEDIMTSSLISVKQENDSEYVEKLMDRFRIRHVMVCDQANQLVGVISDRDIKPGKSVPVNEIMTSNVVTIDESTKIAEAVSIMLNNRISCLPVLKEGQLAGVLSLSDVAISLQCMLVITSDLFKFLRANQPPA